MVADRRIVVFRRVSDVHIGGAGDAADHQSLEFRHLVKTDVFGKSTKDQQTRRMGTIGLKEALLLFAAAYTFATWFNC